MLKRSRVRTGLACAATALGLIAPFMAVGGADALGNNRVVNRSCGSNYVASGLSGSNYWAQTVKNSGDCTGSLGVAFQLSNGSRTTRVNGSGRVDISRPRSSGTVSYGLHWGCLDCNVTTS